MSNNCKHNKLKIKLISAGKEPGQYKGYCSQQCKRMVEFNITEDDVLKVYPYGRNGELYKKRKIFK